MLALVWNSRVETNVASLVQTPNSVTMNKSLLVQLVPAWAQLARGTGPMAPRVSVWAQLARGMGPTTSRTKLARGTEITEKQTGREPQAAAAADEQTSRQSRRAAAEAAASSSSTKPENQRGS